MLKMMIMTVSFLALWQVTSSHADAVIELKDPDMVAFFNKVEILASQDLRINRRLPLAVRVIRLSPDGECDDTPQSCPMEKLYVAASNFELPPQRKVYELPDAYGWEFAGWEYVPMDNEEDDHFFITLTRKVISSDLSSGWWTNKFYRLRVNLTDATLEPVP